MITPLPLQLRGAQPILCVELNRGDAYSSPPVPVPTMDEGSGTLAFIVKLYGGLEIVDGKRMPIDCLVMAVCYLCLAQQILLLWLVTEFVEADDTVDVVFHEPVDRVPDEVLGLSPLVGPLSYLGREERDRWWPGRR